MSYGSSLIMDSVLFSHARHELLSDISWIEEDARKTIREIVFDTETNFDEIGFWPAHPEDGWSNGQQMLSLFWGASSTVWALLRLEQQKAVVLTRAYDDTISKIFEAYLRSPDTGDKGATAPGLLFGKLGFQLLEFRYGNGQVSKADLTNSIIETIRQPELEMMWGAPGAVLACDRLYQWTSDLTWNELKVQAIEFMHKHMHKNASCDSYVWTQDLYGERRQYLGAVHGAAGNYQAILKCNDPSQSELRDVLASRAIEFLKNTVEVEGEFANWPVSIDSETRRYLVQWCHGAVGVLTSLVDSLFSEAPDLFIKGGNLIWKAGPLKKQFGLCHGTAGNGYAFLKLYEHTQDEIWLNRARAFAMHAMEQSNLEFKKHGRRRYALLTGDMGLAMYLQACIDRDGKWPLVDFF